MLNSQKIFLFSQSEYFEKENFGAGRSPGGFPGEKYNDLIFI